MTGADFVALFAMAIVFCALIYLVIWLGDLPASIAKERKHPQVAAIRAMSWLGLLFTGGVVYILAFIWAFYDYKHAVSVAGPEAQAEIESLRDRIATLENELVAKGDAS